MRSLLLACLAVVGLTAQSSLVVFTGPSSPVQTGQSYTLSIQTDTQQVHLVKLDGVLLYVSADCTPTVCSKTVTRSQSAPGVYTHTLTSVWADGSPRPSESLTVTVEGAAIPTWSPAVTLFSGSEFGSIAADGQTVIACRGATAIRCRVSSNEGATFGSEVYLGTDTLYLDQPMAVDGDQAGVLAVQAAYTIYDFLGARKVGPVTLRRRVAGNWLWRQVIATNARALRVALAITGATWHAAWMDFRRGVWDIYYLRSTTAGVTWEPEQILAWGTNSVGAERPSLAVSGDTVHLAWMDARDATQSCQIEGGTRLTFCTEIYTRRSIDGGATWEPETRRTNDAPYDGRPAIAAFGADVLVTHDHRVAGGLNDNGALWSHDAGATWDPTTIDAQSDEQTHGVPVLTASGMLVAWMTRIAAVYQIVAAVDGGGPVQLSSASSGAPSVAASANYWHVVWPGSSVRYRRRVF
jgi:hypothetical protein